MSAAFDGLMQPLREIVGEIVREIVGPIVRDQMQRAYTDLARAASTATENRGVERLWTVKEVAAHVRVTGQTVRAWINSGTLRAVPVGPGGGRDRLLRVRAGDLEVFLAHRVRAADGEQDLDAQAARILGSKRR
jgi:excisionase family DNA binding protein